MKSVVEIFKRNVKRYVDKNVIRRNWNSWCERNKNVSGNIVKRNVDENVLWRKADWFLTTFFKK